MNVERAEQVFRLGAVILAAGASVRMGRPKLLLPWEGKTILAHLIEQWQASGSSQIAVVIEAGSAVERELGKWGGLDRIINPRPDLGMFTSVQSAARWEGWQKELTHFVITLGDQPQVKTETLKDIINFSKENAEWICQPARQGRPRHPVVMPKRIFLEVANSTEADLKQFLRAREQQRRLLEAADAGLDVDLDTPQDYAKMSRSGLS